MHSPCIFLYKKWGTKKKAKKKTTKRQKKTRTKKQQEKVMKVYTTFLVTCVGYHDDGYKPTMLGLYTHFS